MIFDIVFEKDLFTIRRYGAGERDRLGKPTRVLLSSTTVNGLLSQTDTSEGETFVVDEYRAIMPVGTDLRASDEVVARGDVFTVQGTPVSVSAPGMPDIGVVQATLEYVGPVT